MKAIEVLERLRPKHIFDLMGKHANSCDACEFDKAITELFQEAIERERETCAESHLRKVIDKITAKNINA